MRRLLNKKGSVLFLVLVVMSLLIIAASATYYVVRNQSASVNVRYSSEQSYQTAASVSDTVSNYIDGYIAAISKSGDDMGKFKETMVGKMLTMATGTSSEITSEIPLDESMGKAKVSIKKVGTQKKGDDTVHLFEITTNSEVNGETVTITQVKEIVVGPTEYFTRFLTSTGYSPEDTSITANKIISAAFFENDFTRLSNMTMNDSVYSSGSLYDAGINYAGSSKEIVIAENLYMKGVWGTTVKCSEIYVGKNFETNSQISANNVYVLGDAVIGQTQNGTTATVFYVDGNCTISASTAANVKIYVNGDLTINGNVGQGQLYVKGNVYMNNFKNVCSVGEYGGKAFINGTEQAEGWSEQGFAYKADMKNPFSDTDAKKASDYINASTGKQKYEKWMADEYFIKNFSDYVDYNEEDKTYTIKKAITPGEESDTCTGDPASEKPSWIDGDVWNADGTSAVLDQKHTYISGQHGAGTAICYITESCVLRPWKDSSIDNYNTYKGNGAFIVIDTGEKRTNGKELYIMLDKGENDYFSFASDDSIQFTNVLIKGDYPVIFILPDGTEYRTSLFTYIGHANLAVDFCGCADFKELISQKRSVFNSCTGDSQKKLESYIKTIPSDTPGVLPTALIDIGSTVTPEGLGSCTVPDFHNNIFFVTNSPSASIDMEKQSVFYGYIYAPYSEFSINDKGGGNGNNIKFLGGIIVGSYFFNQFGGAMAYTTPYDYADVYELKDKDGNPKPTDIVKHLMKVASGGGGGDYSDDNVIIKPSTTGSPTLGYK